MERIYYHDLEVLTNIGCNMREFLNIDSTSVFLDDFKLCFKDKLGNDLSIEACGINLILEGDFSNIDLYKFENIIKYYTVGSQFITIKHKNNENKKYRIYTNRNATKLISHDNGHLDWDRRIIKKIPTPIPYLIEDTYNIGLSGFSIIRTIDKVNRKLIAFNKYTCEMVVIGVRYSTNHDGFIIEIHEGNDIIRPYYSEIKAQTKLTYIAEREVERLGNIIPLSV